MTYFILWVLVALGMALISRWQEKTERGTGKVSPYRDAGCVHTEADCEACRESSRCGMWNQCI